MSAPSVGEPRDTQPVPQGVLLGTLLPRIREKGGRFRKSSRVHARPAVPGEVVVSTTDTGEETSNTAGAEDVVVENQTRAKELYLVGQAKFDARYEPLGAVDDIWTEYAPLGELRALEVTPDITTLLGVDDEFYIAAPWGTEQVVMSGDYLCAPVPAMNEIYRIARSEFEQTYRAL